MCAGTGTNGGLNTSQRNIGIIVGESAHACTCQLTCDYRGVCVCVYVCSIGPVVGALVVLVVSVLVLALIIVICSKRKLRRSYDLDPTSRTPQSEIS